MSSWPWQDAVLTVVNVGYALALLPALRSRQRPPLYLSAYYGFGCAAAAVVFATLHLWGSTTLAAIQALLWIAVASRRS